MPGDQTPELKHLPVLANEVPQLLVQSPDGIYVDGTFGRGGHSSLILSKLSPKGRLIAFDRDPQAVFAAQKIQDSRFQIIHSAFAEMKEKLQEIGVFRVDGVFLDIGVSSPQIDDPSRGFSFRFDGPLDMRMDPTRGEPLSAWLAQASQEEIQRIIKGYGEEKFAAQIARAIVQTRDRGSLNTTRALADLIAVTVPRNRKDLSQHPATRTFQAFRIFINQELEQLSSALNTAGALLNEHGHLAVISFHSLEDRIVKRFFDQCVNPGKKIDPRLPLLPHQLPQPLFEKALRVLPSQEECAQNPRARSSIMRVAKRTATSWIDQKGAPL